MGVNRSLAHLKSISGLDVAMAEAKVLSAEAEGQYCVKRSKASVFGETGKKNSEYPQSTAGSFNVVAEKPDLTILPLILSFPSYSFGIRQLRQGVKTVAKIRPKS